MKSRPFLSAVLSVAALGGFGYAMLQQGDLRRLRLEQRQLSAQAVLGGTPRSAEASALTKGGSTAKAPLSASERSELMRLRSQVTELKQRQRTLGSVSNENVQLKAKLGGVTNFLGGRMPAGYTPRKDARRLGAATPEAALETFFWAIEHRDATQLLSLFAEGQRTHMTEQFARDQGESFFREAGQVMRGWRLAERRDTSGDDTIFQVEVGPGVTLPMQLTRVEGRWLIDDL